MSTLSSMAALQFIIMTTYTATSDDKLDIMTILIVQCYNQTALYWLMATADYCLVFSTSQELCTQLELWCLLLIHLGWVIHICFSKVLLVQIMDCRLVDTKPNLIQWQNIVNLQLRKKFQWNLTTSVKFIHFHSWKCIWKFCLDNGSHFVST